MTVARRLRGTKVAPFQDTYGWLAYRLGNHEEALEYLEPAAQAIANDPLVHYHLAMTYAALKRDAEALEQLKQAADLIAEHGNRDDLLDTVKAEIETLSTKTPVDN